MPKISEYPNDPAPTGDDLVVTVDSGTGVNKKSTLTSLAASAPFAAQYAPLSTVNRLDRVQVEGYSLFLGGQADEAPTVTNCTLTADTSIKMYGTQSHKMAMAGAVTATLSYDLPATVSGTFSAIELLVYIADATKVTTVTLNLWYPLGVGGWSYNAADVGGVDGWPLVTGWNRIRWVQERRVDVAAPGTFGSVAGVRVVVVTNAATDIYVQQIGAVDRAKASILFIHDGGYTAFDQSPGYDDLKDRNIPVTWSLEVGLIGVNGSYVTEARVLELMAENNNSISFHGYEGEVTAAMTAAQVQSYTMKCIKKLASWGATGRIWRSAWFGNVAAQGPTTNSMVIANPMYGAGGSVERINSWPFINRYDLSRYQLHARTNGEMDAWFAELEANHGLMVCYTHNVSALGGSDISPASWAYFLSKLDTAMAAGWLECVTLEQLMARSGFRIGTGFAGSLTAEWPGVDGTLTKQVLPA